jgi:hypothetical protein
VDICHFVAAASCRFVGCRDLNSGRGKKFDRGKSCVATGSREDETLMKNIDRVYSLFSRLGQSRRHRVGVETEVVVDRNVLYM